MNFDADAPIATFEQDELSFAPLARGLSREILNLDRKTSFVVAINGPWGSGKTSLINLVQAALKDQMQAKHGGEELLLFPYSPWLVSNREALLRDLLPQIAKLIMGQNPWWDHRHWGVRRAANKLRRYARAVRGVELGFNIATATATFFGVPIPASLSPIAVLTKKLGGLVGVATGADPTLDELRHEARKALEAIEMRLVVVLDDLDRLEPSEVLDLARLLRSTLDLPHLSFLVAYDRVQVSAGIGKQLGVDGEQYLEKIIQIDVGVPDCGSYDLSRIAAERLGPVFGDMEDEPEKRLSRLLWLHLRQQFFKTPRDVTRIVNATSFGWALIAGEADPGDLLLLSTLRVKAPNLFMWCRNYVEAYHTDQKLRIDRQPFIRSYKEALSSACVIDKIDLRETVHALSFVLPGIKPDFVQDEINIFEPPRNNEATDAARERRLASEAHWRNYFDLSAGRYGFTETSFSNFINNASVAKNEAIRYFAQAAKQLEPTGTSLAERLLDRIQAEAKGVKLDNQERTSLFRVLANVSDEVSKALGPSGFLQARMFSRFEWAARGLLEPLDQPERTAAIVTALSEDAAFSWLSYLVRSELFSHGRIGNKEREDRRLLSPEGLDEASNVLLQRLREAAKDGTLLSTFDLPIPLYAWRDVSGFPDEPREWVERVTATDDGLVEFIKALKQHVNSTAGDYWKVDQQVLNDFCNPNDVQTRLINLAGGESAVAERATDAFELVERGLAR